MTQSVDQLHGQQVLAEIHEINLSYLMLAQRLIRADRQLALFRLGIPESTAALIGAMTPSQLVRVASSSQVLCSMRFDDEMVWSLLAGDHKLRATDTQANPAVSRLHANILAAGNFSEAVPR